MKEETPSNRNVPPTPGGEQVGQRCLVRFIARCIVAVGICGIIALLCYGSWVVWERSQGIPLRAWLEALGIVAAVSAASVAFVWAIKNAKF